MNISRKLILVASMILAVTIPAAAYTGGRVIFQDLTVSPSGAASKEGHKETIEIASWSFQGSRNGNLQIAQYAVPASVARLCQSHAVLPSMTIEADGTQHVLRNVVFKNCPAGGTTPGTYTFAFEGQTTTPIARAVAPATAPTPDATIAGLTPAKIEARLLSVKIDGNKATVVFMASGAMSLTTNPGPAAGVPSVSEIVVTKDNGRSWSYSGTHVLYQDIFIPAGARSARVIELTIEFQSMTGPRSGYVDRDNPIPSRR